jgi:ankyrin repeat protein
MFGLAKWFLADVTQTPEPEPENLLLRAVQQNDPASLRDLLDSAYIPPVPADAMRIMTPLYVSATAPLALPPPLSCRRYLACQHDRPELVRILLSRPKLPDLDVQIPSANFHTALHAAAQSGNAETVKLLLAAGANPLIKVQLDTRERERERRVCVRVRLRECVIHLFQESLRCIGS